MKLGKNAKKAGAILAVLIIVVLSILLAVSVSILKRPVVTNIIEPKQYFPKDHLNIDASYLLKTGETNESVNVTCDLYLTNIWEKESGEIKATAYVSEQRNNFATFKSSADFGIIDANSTKELNIPVKFSDNSYKVEILLFENNKLIKKVTLTITIYQNYYYGKGGAMVFNANRTKEHVDLDGQWSITSSAPSIYTIN